VFQQQLVQYEEQAFGWEQLEEQRYGSIMQSIRVPVGRRPADLKYGIGQRKPDAAHASWW
jgi:hypothetical protein